MLKRSPSLILPPTCHFLMNIDLGMKLMKPSVCESEPKRLLGIYLGCQTLGRRYVSASVRLITDVQSLDPSRWSVKHPLARSVLSQPISRWLASVSAWPGLTCITSSPSRESQPHLKGGQITEKHVWSAHKPWLLCSSEDSLDAVVCLRSCALCCELRATARRSMHWSQPNGGGAHRGNLWPTVDHWKGHQD